MPLTPKRPRTGQSGPGAEIVTLMPDLCRLARILTRDPVAAEDLMQETLVRVWAQIALGAEIDDLRPYLMTAARNLARRPAPAPLPLSEAPEPAVPPLAEGRIALGEVARALARQPAADVRLILREVAEGESYAEIAAAEGLAIGTVMSRIARSRQRLRAACGLAARDPAAAPLAGSDAA